MSFYEYHKRSIGKTLTYRILILVSNFMIGMVLTGSMNIALGFAGVSFALNTIIYYAHERWWNGVHWGKIKIK